MPIGERERGLHLFALSAVAVAQPLFDLLAHNAGFLVAHRLTPNEILGLAAGLLLAPPAIAWGAEFAAARIGARTGWWLHLGLVAALIGLAVLPPIAGLPRVSGPAAVAVAAVTGALAAFAYARVRWLRRFASMLALGAPIFALSFLASEPIEQLRAAPETAPTTNGAAASPDAPIVMLIFDELPLVSLLDGDERIDTSRYPAFARLAQGATWYREATTVHAQTHLALPALLTGRYAPPTFVPVAAAHPENLFRLLADSYDMNVHETETSLLPNDQNDREQVARDSRPRAADFLSDLWILALHSWLPDDTTGFLPPITSQWRDFGETDPAGKPAAGSYQIRDVRFREFVTSIGPRERPTLHFFHALIPHTPFNFLPSGRRYFPLDHFGQTKATWGDEPWWVMQAWQRHLLQLAFVDRLLGELLDHLVETGLYDPALIVVASDHGGGFWPGELRRNPSDSAHPEDVLRIPLFVKAPNQREGRVSDRNAETIDLLPTITEHLGVELPWETHGCSLLDPECAERTDKVFVTSLGKRLRFTRESLRSRATLDRKLQLFGTGRDGLHQVGSHRALIGRRMDELLDSEPAELLVELLPAPFELARERPAFTLARISGRLRGAKAADALPIAIAVDGVVGAVAPALRIDAAGPLFSAMLPEAFAPKSADQLEFALVGGEAPDWRLHRIPFRIAASARQHRPGPGTVDRR